ncbi:hypothetical protein JCM19233_1717 [Vibrio astriarenae]|nr:hypothetical protein JCM19233_1717 [Vibrio sp. C7]
MITKLYINAMNTLNDLKQDERGVTAIEYGLIAIVMAGIVIAAFFTDGTSFTDELDAGLLAIQTALEGAGL